MANEITLAGSLALSISADGTSLSLGLPASLQKTLATKKWIQGEMSIATTDTVINLGSVATLGYALFINRDATNPIDIKTAAAGTIIARLDAANGFAFFKFGSGVTAPNAIATTAACQMEYFILNT